MQQAKSFLAVSGYIILSCVCVSSFANELHEKSDSSVIRTETGVAVHSRRTKRAITQSIVGFNDQEKLDILKRHNDLRATSGSSNMMAMSWNARLEETAQAWANQCDFEHSTTRSNSAGFDYVGENLYAGTASFDPAHVVQLWFDEIDFYTYATKQCQVGKVCGHYTQVVWASSAALGCGVKYCPVLTSAQTFNKGYNVVCHYGPGGNYVGQAAFLKGEACSLCPKDAIYCNNKLCDYFPQIGSDKGDDGASGLHAMTLMSYLILALAPTFIYQGLQ